MPYTISTQNTSSRLPALNAFISDEELSTFVDNDRITYISHGWQLLLSEMRSDATEDDGTTKGSRSFHIPSQTDYQMLSTGNIFSLPPQIPGTSNLSTNTGGDPGYLNFMAKLRNARLFVRIRTIGGFNGDGTLSSVGSWTSASVTESTSTYDWVQGQLAFPTTMSAGDLYQIDVLARASGASTGYVAGYMVWERVLTNANP